MQTEGLDIKETGTTKTRGVSKNCSINFNFKDWVYLEKNKKTLNPKDGILHLKTSPK